MKTYEGHIKYNDNQRCYGMMGNDGNWVKEKLENGDQIDIVINGELFSTEFEGTPDYPVLNPHHWDNWEFLSGLPAVYHDFGKTAKEQPITKEGERRLRYTTGLICIGSSLGVCVLFGAILALMGFGGNTYLKNLIDASKAMFWLFGAGLTASGLLAILNILPVNLCIGFGCALYYGTIFLSAFLSNFIYGADINRYCISFVIVSLVCYIVWLKRFKPDDPT